MVIYTGALIWVLVIYLYNNNGVIALDETQEVSFRQALFAMSYLVFFIGLRSAGADTATYISGYNQYPTGVEAVVRALFDFKTEETLFVAYGIAMKTLFGSNYAPYLLGIATITGFAVVKCLQKYSVGFFTSMILFILWGTWTWMFNGMRQFLAVAITFWSLSFIDEDNPIKYIIAVLIAGRIHTSALMLVPLYFLIRSEPWHAKTVATIFMAVLAVVFSNRFLSLFGTITARTEYGNILTSNYFLGDDGSNPIRTLLFAIPPILAFLVRDTIERDAPDVIKICVNMSIICVCVSAIANVTSGIYIGRLPIFFSVYNMILIPWIFCSTDIRDRQGLIPGIMFLYFTEYVYEYYFRGHIYYASDILHLFIR